MHQISHPHTWKRQFHSLLFESHLTWEYINAFLSNSVQNNSVRTTYSLTQHKRCTPSLSGSFHSQKWIKTSGCATLHLCRFWKYTEPSSAFTNHSHLVICKQLAELSWSLLKGSLKKEKEKYFLKLQYNFYLGTLRKLSNLKSQFFYCYKQISSPF